MTATRERLPGADDWDEVYGRIDAFFNDKTKTEEQIRLLELMHQFKVACNIARDEEEERRFWLLGQELMLGVFAVAGVVVLSEFLVKVNEKEDPSFVLMLLIVIICFAMMDGVLIADSKQGLRSETLSKTKKKDLGEKLLALVKVYEIPNASKFSLYRLVIALEMQEKKRKEQQLVAEVMAEEALRKQSQNTDHLELDEGGSVASAQSQD